MNATLEYFHDAASSARFAHMLESMFTGLAQSHATVRKGKATRAAILAQALHIASIDGLNKVTFGSIAEQMKMTKSGVFAQFQSKEKLLLAVLELCETKFAEDILVPALNVERGLPRLNAMFTRWMDCCVSKTGADRPLIKAIMVGQMEDGSVQEKLTDMIRAWKETLHQYIVQAIDAGHLRADTDAAQLVYELYGIILALHQQARFFGVQQSSLHARTAFERLVRTCRGRPPNKTAFNQANCKPNQNR